MKYSNSNGKISINISGKEGNMNTFIYGSKRSGTNRIGNKKMKKRKVR